MNLNDLLNQFIQPQAAGTHQQQAQASPGGGLGDIAKNLAGGVPGGLAGGLAAGGVLGLLMGNKKVRKSVGKVAGSAVGLGGAAILGAVAYNAYQNWQKGGGTSPAPTPQGRAPSPASGMGGQGTGPALLEAPTPESFAPDAHAARDGNPFQLSLIKAMVGAANADGHIDSHEQKAIFDAVEKFELGSDEKAFVFDTLRNPPNIEDIAASANGLEQASELYLAARLAIDPDVAEEKAYLSALSQRLGLPDDFVAHLEREIASSAM